MTPENPNFESQKTLIARNMGGLDLMVILPDQGRLQDQIRNFLKTDLYIRQNSGVKTNYSNQYWHQDLDKLNQKTRDPIYG